MEVIFVFGSNLRGRHGAGSALEAKQNWGAIQGKGWGRQGASYAIPTKGRQMEVLSLPTIREYVDAFIMYAMEHPTLKFEVVNIGCGLAGYKPIQIAPLFRKAPSNCVFQKEFQEVLDRLPK